MKLAPWSKRQALAGGDATTDVRMLRDATGVHVVLNRNRAELMCHAFYNRDRRWVVNPMFIQPLPKYEPGYPCSTTAFTRADGSSGPVREAARSSLTRRTGSTADRCVRSASPGTRHA